MTNVLKIEGIGEAYAVKLKHAGVLTVETLLKQGASEKGRKELAKKGEIREDLILEWVNRADLFRIKGVGVQYSDLLEAAGVDTVPELAQRSPASLLQKLQAANEHRKVVRRLPVLAQVESWVSQAKQLPRLITY